MKKIIATLAALATLAIATPIQSSAYCGELYAGDADHDGEVTPADASMVLREYSRVSTLPQWAAKYEPYYHWHDDNTFVAYVNGELIPCIDIMISNDRGIPYAQFIDHNGEYYAATDSNFQYDIDVCYWEYVE